MMLQVLLLVFGVDAISNAALVADVSGKLLSNMLSL